MNHPRFTDRQIFRTLSPTIINQDYDIFQKNMNNLYNDLKNIHVHKKISVQYILENLITPMSMDKMYHDSFLLISAAMLMPNKLVNLTDSSIVYLKYDK